jgi:ABC-type tungstate transport system permease subunit
MVRRGAALVGALAIAFFGAVTHADDTRSIRLASTTSVENSGLLDQILPNFTKETGIGACPLARHRPSPGDGGAW